MTAITEKVKGLRNLYSLIMVIHLLMGQGKSKTPSIVPDPTGCSHWNRVVGLICNQGNISVKELARSCCENDF